MDAGTETIRVLHVDDDPEFASLASTFLQREAEAELDIITAESATEGLSHLADTDVDCIVSDYEMPETNGIEFLCAVRNRHSELPFILFTGRGSEEVARDAFQAGATDYMQKETGVEQYTVLANRVHNAVSQHRAQTASERYGTVIQALDNAVFNLDADAQFTSVNGRFVSLLGYDRDAVLGRHVSFVGTDRQGSSETPENTIKRQFHRIRSPMGPDTVQFETTLATADGESVVCLGHLTLLPAHGDEFTGAVGTLHDITERRRRTELLRYHDGLKNVVLDAATTMMSAEVDEIDTKVRWTLQTLGEFVGLDRCRVFKSDADGNAFFETHVWTADERAGPDVNPGLDDLNADDTDADDVDADDVPDDDNVNAAFVNDRGRRFRTSLFPWMWSRLSQFENVAIADVDDLPSEATSIANVMRTGDVRAAVVVPLVSQWSLTGCVSFELCRPTESWSDAELRHLRAVGDIVAYTLARKRRERTLSRQNRRLEEFASVVAHDLRNPLNVADGFLELAQETEDHSYLDRVADAVDRMDALIEDVLTLARQGPTVTETETVAVERVVDDAWRAVDTVDTDAAVRCASNLGTVEADATRLTRALENLFRNAVEHAGQAVTVRVGALPGDHGFYVEDDGPGIPADEWESVFEYGHSTDEGMGLGLAIVERIAYAHGWDVTVTSAGGGGARFEFDCRTEPLSWDPPI